MKSVQRQRVTLVEERPGQEQLTVKEDLEGGGVLAVVGDDDTRASDNLPGLALSVNLLQWMSAICHT